VPGTESHPVLEIEIESLLGRVHAEDGLVCDVVLSLKGNSGTAGESSSPAIKYVRVDGPVGIVVHPR
jgi:hypothetical protein